MKSFVLASKNKNKIKEMQNIFKDYQLEIISPPDDFNPEETGATFEENAIIKAKEAAKLCKKPALADDSGLAIEALKGAPGVYSARFEETNEKRIAKVLKMMENKQNKKAKFVCAMAFVNEKGEVIFKTTGECHGEITTSAKGNQGFGYDPIFFIPSQNKTMAELSMDKKNQISHRSIALKGMVEKILNYKK